MTHEKPEMINCIYCKKDSTGSSGKEHIIPEALGCKDCLPVNYVCDSCNNYFSKLDKSVLYNRAIAIHVGAEQIPGKKNHIRRSITNKLSFPKKGNFTLTLGPITIPQTGAKEITFQPKQSNEFDELQFARAVHKMAFNCYAGSFGNRNALHSRFDNLRNYIRQPARNELWHYGVKQTSRDDFLAARFFGEPDTIVELHLFIFNFYISLTTLTSPIERELRRHDILIINRVGAWSGNSMDGL